jgi:uncharacterized protein YggE
MKKITVLVTALFLFASVQSQTKNFIDQPYIEVAGYADTLVVPDEIFINILFSERDTKDKISIEEIENKMVASLKSLGIDVEKNLSASDIASNFKLYLLKKKDIMKTKSYVLKVNDAFTATRVFMALEDLDISNANIDRVSHSKAKQIQNTMRSWAVTDAKQRSVALTEPLNQKAGSAIHIADNDFNPVANDMLRGKLAEVVISGYNSMKNEVEPANISFEKIKIASTVSVQFILLPEGR